MIGIQEHFVEVAETLDAQTNIQRYMDLPKFLHLLETSKLFLSKISNFEDRLEGGLTHIDAMILNGTAAILDFMVNRLLPRAEKISPEEREKENQENEIIKQKIDSSLIKTVFGEYDRSRYRDVFNRQRDWLDVCCWHRNDQESMAMWKIYGGSANAICIESSVTALARSIIIADGSKTYLSDVSYIDHENDHFSKKHLLSPYLHKSKFYSFEQEIRLIKYQPKSNIMEQRDEPGSYIDVNLSELIQSIRVSPEAPKWFHQLITDVVKNRYRLDVNITYSRMKRDPIF